STLPFDCPAAITSPLPSAPTPKSCVPEPRFTTPPPKLASSEPGEAARADAVTMSAGSTAASTSARRRRIMSRSTGRASLRELQPLVERLRLVGRGRRDLDVQRRAEALVLERLQVLAGELQRQRARPGRLA